MEIKDCSKSTKPTSRIFIMEPTDEYRAPKKGEWYMAYNDWPVRADHNLDYSYYILSVTIKPYEGNNV